MIELARWGTRGDATSLELPLRVAGYDIDFAGHVNNAVYIRWLEDLRTVWMTRWMPLEQCIERGLTPVLTRIEIDYRAPLKLGQRVVGRVWVASVTKASAVMESEIERVDDARVCAQARQSVAFISLTTGRPMRVPPEFREAACPPP
jgi:acyl-CoA thioester hydrolase